MAAALWRLVSVAAGVWISLCLLDSCPPARYLQLKLYDFFCVLSTCHYYVKAMMTLKCCPDFAALKIYFMMFRTFLLLIKMITIQGS